MRAVDMAGLFGRREDGDAIRRLLDRDRLLVLFGSPGVGKSALANAIANDVAQSVVVDLGDVGSEPAFLERTAAAMNIAGPADGLGERILRALRERGRTLLVLDDCERLGEEVAGWAPRWLEAAPELHVLIASRLRFELAVGTCMELAPLPLPASADPTAEPALALLVDAARRVGVQLGDEELPAVVEIARLLDGIPLALQIAARHLDTLSPREVAERLERHLDLRAPVAGRHATMHEAISWSWELLRPALRRALAQCAIFEGSFTLEAASAVVQADHPRQVPDLVRQLYRHSLLSVVRRAGQRRYRLQRCVRSFAAERLAEFEPATTALRHDVFYTRLAKVFSERLGRDGDHTVIEQIGPEVRDLAAVVRRGAVDDPRSAGRALRCWLTLAEILHPTREFVWRDGLDVVDRLLASGTCSETRLVAEGRVLRCFLLMTADPEAALTTTARIVDDARRRGDRYIEGRARSVRADALHFLGRFEEAVREHLLATTLLRAGPVDQLVRAECHFASTLRQLGRFAEAQDVLYSALERAERVGSAWLEVQVRARLANIALDTGDVARAEPRFQRVLELARAVGNDVFTGFSMGCLASIDHERGDLERALEGYERAVTVLKRVGEPLAGELAALRGTAAWELGDDELARAEYSRALILFGRAHYGAFRRLWRACLLALRGKPIDGLDGPVTPQTEQALAYVEQLSRVHAGTDVDAEAIDAWCQRPRPLLSVEARLLERVLRKVVERRLADTEQHATDPRPCLRLDPSRKAFTLPGERCSVSLLGHDTLWRVLRVLVACHQEGPEARVTVEEMLERAWPDERLLVRRARNRVYVALSKLRQRGLGPYLARDERGYFLAPELRVEVSDGSRSDAVDPPG